MATERATARVDWLVDGSRSGRAIVTAPGRTDVGDAVVRVDAALDGFAGPVPGWFRGLERLGFWWYVICVVVGVGITLAVGPASVVWRVASGVTLGLILAPVSLVLLRALARGGSRADGAASPAQALAHAAAHARPVNGEIVMQVGTVLGRDAGRADAVHRMAWRAAGGDASARKELEAAWEAAAPDAAAARAEKVARLQAEIDADKARGQDHGRA